MLPYTSRALHVLLQERCSIGTEPTLLPELCGSLSSKAQQWMAMLLPEGEGKKRLGLPDASAGQSYVVCAKLLDSDDEEAGDQQEGMLHAGAARGQGGGGVVSPLAAVRRRLAPDVRHPPSYILPPINIATYNVLSMGVTPQLVEDALFGVFAR